MAERLLKSQFAESLHSTFRVLLEEGQAYDLELVELREFNFNARIEQFSLLFRGSLNMLLPQGIYSLAHPVMGTFELFLVPLGPDAGGAFYLYESVFNRFIQEV